MKKWLAMLAAASCVLSFAVQAADAPAKKAPTAQQQKMTTCNAEAKTKALKGDERKAFMKECLSKKKEAPAAAAGTQQDKMKSCNAEAKTKALKGDERKAFMKGCLAKAA
ncbi:PsiF family protein [Comamonas flocculans]|uniref:Phosphate starvation-inducible protein PsiF n=1 Tax=Comamonas flocculans TaxID=2597701 RepID=A0A5B8RYL4_9BURK|nr:PsiF family protein [Comamonas flocculans]QEA12917.1 phosphate starvation-inducible protein PsiF [Comamonas flocculans]